MRSDSLLFLFLCDKPPKERFGPKNHIEKRYKNIFVKNFSIFYYVLILVPSNSAFCEQYRMNTGLCD